MVDLRGLQIVKDEESIMTHYKVQIPSEIFQQFLKEKGLNEKAFIAEYFKQNGITPSKYTKSKLVLTSKGYEIQFNTYDYLIAL